MIQLLTMSLNYVREFKKKTVGFRDETWYIGTCIKLARWVDYIIAYASHMYTEYYL